MADKTTLGARPVKVRHVKRSQSGTTVLGTVYAGDWDGLAGRGGFVSGTFERRLYEEGTGTLRLPNAAGSDGRLHRDRFACLTDPGYLPGDEWLEVYEDGDLVAVWTPTGRQSKRRTELQIAGEDAVTLLKRTREGEYGYWCHAPRDVMEHYGRVWRGLISEGFSPGPTFTYSGASQTTADGAWTYQRCEQANPGSLRLRVPAGATPNAAWLQSTVPVTRSGPGQTDPHDAWQMDVTLTYSGLPSEPGLGNYGNLAIGLTTSALVGMYVLKGTTNFASTAQITAGFVNAASLGPWVDPPGPLRITIAKHGSWVFFLLNGRLAGAFPPQYGWSSVALYPTILLFNPTTAYSAYCDVEEIRFRRADRLLIDDGAGDLRLPGRPTAGGLNGEYFDMSSDVAKYGTGTALAYQSFRPGVDPAMTRIEPTIDFASSNPPAWRPANVPPTNFVARYTGAIYLDLSNKDIAVRVTADEEGVLWIGHTRLTEQLLAASSGTAASVWLKAGSSSGSAPSGSSGPLAGQQSGWYPIRLEYKQAGAAGACQLQWEDSTAVGTWTAVPQTALSPYGIYHDQVRQESHYDALKAVAETFGYQWTCDPRPLESGQFPGRVAPNARVGRDTERVLDEPETTDIQADIDVDARADLVSADASGISDPSGGAQLSAEVENAAGLAHLYLGQSYESLSDIGQEQLLLQRLNSLVTLRSAVWEEVSARPPGHRQLLDSWPLTGSLAEFAWAPGDGLRLNFPTVGIVDAIPRQILGVSREFAPDGMKPPAASFRPRPRTPKSLLREVRRDALLPQRNYQQQLAQLTGSIGGTGGTDGLSRITLPPAARVVSVQLAVLYKSDASSWNLYVNLVDSLLDVTTIGTADITAVTKDTPGGYNFATLTGGTGTWTIQLVATIRV